ncbi:MAG TPA: hypothetical protein VF665_24680 [Longimicrobium sp.]|jgi:hypothetical protein|uniref:hypothetical protein n=1 Tax=Longimicrobium sp. TaxID=2029185 RepID=UPI002ED92BA6
MVSVASTSIRQFPKQFAVALLLAGSASAGLAIHVAAQGAGTKFMACRSTAWSDYSSCSAANSGWGQVGCEVAIELDLLGCDAELVRDLNPLG